MAEQIKEIEKSPKYQMLEKPDNKAVDHIGRKVKDWLVEDLEKSGTYVGLNSLVKENNK